MNLHSARLCFSLQRSWRKWWRSLQGSCTMRPFITADKPQQKSAKSCTFRSNSSSSPGARLGLHQGNLPSGRWLLLPHHPPKLLPLCLAVGRGRSFEGCSLPSQPLVGGVLGQYWHVWLLGAILSPPMCRWSLGNVRPVPLN